MDKLWLNPGSRLTKAAAGLIVVIRIQVLFVRNFTVITVYLKESDYTKKS